MKTYVHIVDDFFGDIEAIRAEIETFTRADTVNPRDGKVYSNITVPAQNSRTVELIGEKLAAILHMPVQLTLVLSRLCLAGGYAPYHAHSDSFMGSLGTIVIYMNKPEHCQGGTAFLRHKATGLEVWDKKTPPALTKKLDADVSDPSKWETVFFVPMKENRATIYSGKLLHQSEPTDGFGSSKEDGRIVLAALFDPLPKKQ